MKPILRLMPLFIILSMFEQFSLRKLAPEKAQALVQVGWWVGLEGGGSI